MCLYLKLTNHGNCEGGDNDDDDDNIDVEC